MKKYNLILFGGTSTIGIEYLLKRIESLKKNYTNISIILIGRNKIKLNIEKNNFKSLDVRTSVYRTNLEIIDTKIIKIINNIRLDEVIFSYGKLFQNKNYQKILNTVKENLQVNLLSKVVYLEASTLKIEKQKVGRIVVFGSVAGDVGRKSNYPYGSANSALEKYVEGLQHKLSKYKNINITLVKLGYVNSKMTDHIANKNFLWISPSTAARIIEKKVLDKKRKTYVPFFWFWIMIILKNLPKFVFNRFNI